MTTRLPVLPGNARGTNVGARGSRRRPALLGILLLLTVITGCARTAPSSPPMRLPDTYIVADDFTRPNPAWARFDTEESAVYALAGELFLEDRGKGTAVYTPLIGYDDADVAIEVDIRHVQGTVNNWMGVLCRLQDEDNYYLLAVSADGYYLLLRTSEGKTSALVGPEFSEHIRLGRAENALRARCQGPTLTLWVNDERLTSYRDPAPLQGGGVGLFADAVPRGEIVVVAFDNFILAAP
jgi:hypothetical protein